MSISLDVWRSWSVTNIGNVNSTFDRSTSLRAEKKFAAVF
jgi:hypothetical protein